MFRRLIALAALACCGISAQSIVVIGSPSAITSIRKVTTTDTATTSDYTILADASGAAFTETLPASPYKGEIVNIKKIDSSANAVTISGNGVNIDGSSTAVVSVQYTTITMQYDSATAQWWVL